MSGLEKPLYLTKHTLFLLFLQVVSVFVRSPHALTDMVRHGVQGCKRVRGQGQGQPWSSAWQHVPLSPSLQNHKMVWLGRDFKGHQSQPSGMDRDTFHQTRLLKVLSNLVLNTSGDGVSTASLDNLCHCLITLPEKMFFLISNVLLSSVSLKSVHGL